MLTGNAGNNILDGGAGVDSLIGGLGDDTYIVDILQSGVATKSIDTTPVARLGLFASLNKPAPTPAAPVGALQDTITEASNAGNDTLELRGNLSFNNAVTITLGNNLEYLDASHTGTTLLNLTGNTLNNTITGNDANNTLDGAAGADTLMGGLGDDTYLVDIVASGIAPNTIAILQDSITENVNEGSADTLKLRGSVALTNASTISLNNDLANIEHLDISATGTTKLNLVGNDANNFLTGNAAANTLIGGNGNDRLDGGLGNDILDGGDGDDTYVLNVVTDIITNETSGNDTVEVAFTASLTDAKFADIENVTLTGLAAINATGNSQDNALIGNDGANTLDGGAGADNMAGGKGNDIYIVDNIGDTATETLTLAQLGGVDLVKSSVDFTLSANLDNLTLTDDTLNGGTANLNGTGNALANVLTGNAGNNILDGGAGVDSLIGGLGDDTYIVDILQSGVATKSIDTTPVARLGLFASLNKPAPTPAAPVGALQDTITEASNAGNDTLELRGNLSFNNAVTITLGNNLEYLDASHTGTTLLNLTGNTLNNTITGNDANNTLDGAAGADTLMGGLGDDTYLVDIVASGIAPNTIAILQDSITENVNEGSADTLKLRGSVALTNASTISLNNDLANIEHLDISATGTTKLNLVGNDANNFLTGNAAANTLIGGNGNDRLDGGLGNDILDGGDGDDTYVLNVVTDIITNETSGNDTVEVAFTASLTDAKFADIENVTLTGLAAINATGNSQDNALIGNDGANTLDGGAGNDTLNGNAGNDILSGGNDHDTLIGGLGNDILTGGLGADTFVWNLADKGVNGRPALDKVTDFNLADGDILDLHDLLVNESSANILNFLDISTSTSAGITNTEIRISNTGGFSGGNFTAAAENQHITLAGVNLLTGTNETDLLANLIAQNKLIIDV